MTFAEMNKDIAKDVLFIEQVATMLRGEMDHEDTEGCTVLEALLSIQTAVNRAVERYL